MGEGIFFSSFVEFMVRGNIRSFSLKKIIKLINNLEVEPEEALRSKTRGNLEKFALGM